MVEIGDVIEPTQLPASFSRTLRSVIEDESAAECATKLVAEGRWRVVPKEELIETESYTNQNNPSLE